MAGWKIHLFLIGDTWTQMVDFLTDSSRLKMDGWNTNSSFWDGLPIFRGELLVLGSVINQPPPLIKGNQWVFIISTDHNSGYFRWGYVRGGWLISHNS